MQDIHFRRHYVRHLPKEVSQNDIIKALVWGGDQFWTVLKGLLNTLSPLVVRPRDERRDSGSFWKKREKRVFFGVNSGSK